MKKAAKKSPLLRNPTTTKAEDKIFDEQCRAIGHTLVRLMWNALEADPTRNLKPAIKDIRSHSVLSLYVVGNLEQAIVHVEAPRGSSRKMNQPLEALGSALGLAWQEKRALRYGEIEALKKAKRGRRKST